MGGDPLVATAAAEPGDISTVAVAVAVLPVELHQLVELGRVERRSLGVRPGKKAEQTHDRQDGRERESIAPEISSLHLPRCLTQRTRNGRRDQGGCKRPIHH